MVNKSLAVLACVGAMVGASGCGGGLGEVGNEKMTVLDAAAAYEANRELIHSIRGFYPGPFDGFFRVPDRNPAKQTTENKAFIEKLRQQFPVEYIDFFPMGDTKRDEIDVVLTKYGANTNWSLVSLVYVGVPLPQPEEGSNMAVYDTCDQRATEWLADNSGPKRVEVFCQLSENWYAYQRFE